MDKQFARYMRIGKKVEIAGTVYQLIEDMRENKETVKAVNEKNLRRYELLRAWSRNHVGVTEEQAQEMKGYEEELVIESVEPHNKVRFITSDYKTKFEVNDLSNVIVDGVTARVAYLDECHFTFVDKINTNLYGGCFHICQFAELCEKNGIEVKPVEKE